jgi:two-component system sensor histidine kinase RegB
MQATAREISAGPGRIKLDWLVKLHWGAIVGQTAAILGVHHSGVVALPLALLLSLVALEAAVNVALELWLRRGPDVSDAALAGVMLLDTVVLTALLHLSGGHFNPFSTLYLVNVALAAILLPARWSWIQFVLSVLAFGSLFPLQDLAPFGVHDHAAMMEIHLQGMLVAFAIAAFFIVLIVQRVIRALDRRDEELARARGLAERRQKLASLATLAAGAAHELATPLATIAIAATELDRELARCEAVPGARADLDLIRGQVARCKDILQQMAARAGENAGEALVPVRVADWAARALDGLPGAERVVLDVSGASDGLVRGPPRGLERALRVLLQNALQASGEGSPVALRASARASTVVVEVADRGSGMAPEVLARAGEPFFTTKEPGRGSGLGLFLARALLEQLGGELELESAPGRGTRARIVLPAAGPVEGVA